MLGVFLAVSLLLSMWWVLPLARVRLFPLNPCACVEKQQQSSGLLENVIGKGREGEAVLLVIYNSLEATTNL